MQKNEPQKTQSSTEEANNNISFIDALKVGNNPSLAEVLTAPRQSTTQSSLSDDGWRLEDKHIAKLRQKLMNTGKTLKETYGSPLRGIVSGCNEAFVIDGNAKDALIAQDAKSAELLKPFLEGKDLKPWHVEPRDLWLIYIAKGAIDIDDYPAIREYLLPYKRKLESRATKQAWFELQQPQQNYVPAFEGKKIVYPNFFGRKGSFSLANEGLYLNNKIYLVAENNFYLLGILNSSVTWFILTSMCTFKSGQYYDMHSIYVEKFPIPKASKTEQQAVADEAAEIQGLAEARFKLEQDFRHRIACDLGGAPDAKLNKKLHDWPALDFVNFRKEVKKAFKTDIPLAERSDWEDYLQAQSQKVADLSQSIQQQEEKLNHLVYALFKLKDKDITIIAESIT